MKVFSFLKSQRNLKFFKQKLTTRYAQVNEGESLQPFRDRRMLNTCFELGTRKRRGERKEQKTKKTKLKSVYAFYGL